MILPSTSSDSTDFSCATTTSITTTFSQLTIGGDDCFSVAKKTNYHSSKSICTQAESSVSSSSSEANDDNQDGPWRYAIVPSPCLKIKTAEESLSRLYNFGSLRASSSGKRALAMLTALSTSASSLSFSPFAPPKHVQFSNVTVHFHALILGDHPSVSEGPPLMLDWKAFESIAYETVDDFQENREPQHEGPSRQRQPQRRAAYTVPTETRSGTSTTSTTATAVTPRVPLHKNQKRKWPAHQRRYYLKNKLGVTGTDILRVEFEVRRIQQSRKAEARVFAMEQLLAARHEEEEVEEDFNAANNNNSRAPFVHGVSVDDEYVSRGLYYGSSVEQQQQIPQAAADEYTYHTYDSLLDENDDDDDCILAEANNNNDCRRAVHGAAAVVLPDVAVCFSIPRHHTSYTAMPSGCWHPAKVGKGWFVIPKELHNSTN